MKRSKILYLMNVSWFWIKQRPQFLAEELSRFFPITVVCMEDHNKNLQLQTLNIRNRLSFLAFRKITVGTSSPVITRFNSNYRKYLLKRQVKKHEIIWFNSPSQYVLAEKIIPSEKIVIYDCMDDAAAFQQDPNIRDTIRTWESKLCSRANLVLCSSIVLRENLNRDYSVGAKIRVVNNALKQMNDENTNLPGSVTKLFDKKDRIYVVYIGTISRWFDFSLMMEMLSKFPGIELIIFGPADTDLPVHPQIYFPGVVDHSYVSSIMDLCDALIMPFVLTDLVKAVNPVKAYEYISSGKPVILKRYEETLPFENFAYLYSDKEELFSLFSKLAESGLKPKKTLLECRQFRDSNTWQHRAEEIKKCIDEICRAISHYSG